MVSTAIARWSSIGVGGALLVSLSLAAWRARAEAAEMRGEISRLEARSRTLEQRLPKIEAACARRAIAAQGSVTAPHAVTDPGVVSERAPLRSERSAAAPAEAANSDAEPSLPFADLAMAGFAEQAPDVGWTRETRWRVTDAVAASSALARVRDVDCRTRWCRILVDHPSADDQRQVALALAGAEPFDAGTVVEYSNDGRTLVTTLYVARSGHELAEARAE